MAKTRVLLVGRIGQGKSALGNFLLGQPGRFETMAGLSAVTGKSDHAYAKLCDIDACVIDTPGLQEAYGAEEDFSKDPTGLDELVEGIKLAAESEDGGEPGVDVILYVVSINERFGRDQAAVVQYFEEQGPFWDHVILVFSRADAVGSDEKSQREFVDKQRASRRFPQMLATLLKKRNNEYIVVNSLEMDQRYRRNKLREFSQQILNITLKMNGKRYTTELIRELEKNPDINIKEKIQEEVREKGGQCFPGSSLVVTKTGLKSMQHLQIGDELLCMGVNSKKEFSEVIAFLHYSPKQQAQYLAFETEKGPAITVSRNHIIFSVKSCLKPRPVLAGEIKEGDYIFVVDPGKPNFCKVTKIHTVQKRGVYAPLTRSGVIVVDGVMASCYASFHSHDLAHVAFAPLRLYSSISKGPPQPKEGIHGYAMSLYKAVKLLHPHSVGH